MKKLNNIIKNLISKLKASSKAIYINLVANLIKLKATTYKIFFYIVVKKFLVYKRVLRLNIIRSILKLRRKFLNIIKKQWFEFIDALFIGSLFLIIFKLIYRIFLDFNPFWLTNILFYVLGMFVQLYKYDILNVLREKLVKIYKKILPFNMWLDIDAYFRITQINLHKRMENYNPSIIKKFFENIFYFLVFIRLFIYSYPFKYIFCNFLVTYWFK